MTALAPADRQRLAKLLGLLGSEFAGERDAAGLAAVRLLRERGLTWPDVIGAPPPAKPWTPPSRQPAWHDTVRRCRAKPGALRPWERTFLGGLDAFPRLSPKQRAILDEIAEWLDVKEAAR